MESLLKNLEGLKQGTQNAILRPAIRSGSAIINAAAKMQLRKGHGLITGQMRRSMGVVIRTPRKRGSMYAVIGPRHGFRIPVRATKAGGVKYHDPAKIAHLVEYGHGGPAPANPTPFLRPAIDATRGGVLSTMRTKIQGGLSALAARGRK